MKNDVILLGHGSGGRLSRELIVDFFIKAFDDVNHTVMSDSAVLPSPNEYLAFTTDSYVIDPVFFPGGDIGKLAITGTVNDLAVSGAIPKYLSVACIIEEGFLLSDVKRIAHSMASEAKNAGVRIVTGDTKVVKRGQCDKIYITTSGVGFVPENRRHIASGNSVCSGDKIIVSGYLGDHAIAILSARENICIDTPMLSDLCSLNDLIDTLSDFPEHIHFMRDITRGGLATVLVEICEKKNFGLEIHKNLLPIQPAVKSICELYGFDPLYLANEGKIVLVVTAEKATHMLTLIRSHPRGAQAEIVGEITTENPGMVLMETGYGSKKMIDMLHGEMLPRIC